MEQISQEQQNEIDRIKALLDANDTVSLVAAALAARALVRSVCAQTPLRTLLPHMDIMQRLYPLLTRAQTIPSDDEATFEFKLRRALGQLPTTEEVQELTVAEANRLIDQAVSMSAAELRLLSARHFGIDYAPSTRRPKMVSRFQTLLKRFVFRAELGVKIGAAQ